ncbi:MAG: hypothetical protein QM695_13070 [Micropruina sp.]
MRTTLTIADDVLIAAKERAKVEGRTAGEVLSDLARIGLAGAPRPAGAGAFLGFQPLARRGDVVTNELVEALREELGE